MRPECKLQRYYKNILNKYNKHKFKSSNSFCSYLITYLRYKRDQLILTLPVTSLATNMELNSLCLAISEYEEYLYCIYKYYNIINDVPQVKASLNLSAEEVLKLYQKDKNKHWTIFWNLVKNNLEN